MATLPTNTEGLTFPEWIQAAGYYAKFLPKKLRKAWKNGEDPSEHLPDAPKRFLHGS